MWCTPAFTATSCQSLILVLAPALGGVLPSILKLLRITDIIYYLDILVGCAILPIYVSSCRKLGRLDAWRPARVSAGLALAAFLVAGPTVWMMWENRRDSSLMRPYELRPRRV